jgi:hypothetical protein
MNQELELKLQAHLDGELSEREARELSQLLDGDTDAQFLSNELRMVKTALSGNELGHKLPETREFYWSKIAREIEHLEKQPQRAPLFGWWKPAFVRYIGGFAAAAALLMISFLAFNQQNSYTPSEQDGAGDMASITYHSDADQMTIVYLFDRQQDQTADSEELH